MQGPRGAIFANHHSFPHAVDSTLEVQAAGFRSQQPRAHAIYQCVRTAPNLADDLKILSRTCRRKEVLSSNQDKALSCRSIFKKMSSLKSTRENSMKMQSKALAL
eukprot:2957126-Pleurochrysis_carterae.AAC.1